MKLTKIKEAFYKKAREIEVTLSLRIAMELQTINQIEEETISFVDLHKSKAGELRLKIENQNNSATM